jgi:hypothetical protein
LSESRGLNLRYLAMFAVGSHPDDTWVGLCTEPIVELSCLHCRIIVSGRGNKAHNDSTNILYETQSTERLETRLPFQQHPHVPYTWQVLSSTLLWKERKNSRKRVSCYGSLSLTVLKRALDSQLTIYISCETKIVKRGFRKGSANRRISKATFL